jgi:hypothetical protein
MRAKELEPLRKATVGFCAIPCARRGEWEVDFSTCVCLKAEWKNSVEREKAKIQKRRQIM